MLWLEVKCKRWELTSHLQMNIVLRRERKRERRQGQVRLEGG